MNTIQLRSTFQLRPALLLIALLTTLVGCGSGSGAKTEPKPDTNTGNGGGDDFSYKGANPA
ncbi:MAG TPA: hypothetical protein DIW64_06680, partial [Cellvibrio sp.]|nr:hypothetical protein [Cellvibrio sp.]